MIGCAMLLVGLAFGQDVKPAAVRARDVTELKWGMYLC